MFKIYRLLQITPHNLNTSVFSALTQARFSSQLNLIFSTITVVSLLCSLFGHSRLFGRSELFGGSELFACSGLFGRSRVVYLCGRKLIENKFAFNRGGNIKP